MTEKEISEFVKPLYEQKDSKHNFKHILRIKKRVNLYKKDYKKVDEQKLEFLVYFHGLGEYVKGHEEKITNLGIPKQWLTSLYRHTKNPLTIEEKLVSDANLWEAVGVYGIKKSLQVGKEREQTTKQTLKIMRNNISKVKFYTKKGKESGEPGIKVIKEFLKNAKIH